MPTTTITASSTITIRQTPDVSVRKRVSIPATDTATLAWWDAQDDVATSLRLMILEEVAAYGYADRLARIVVPVQPAASQAATSSASTGSDPRDEEIARLRLQLADLHAKVGPLLPFLPGLVDDLVV